VRSTRSTREACTFRARLHAMREGCMEMHAMREGCMRSRTWAATSVASSSQQQPAAASGCQRQPAWRDSAQLTHTTRRFSPLDRPSRADYVCWRYVLRQACVLCVLLPYHSVGARESDLSLVSVAGGWGTTRHMLGVLSLRPRVPTAPGPRRGVRGVAQHPHGHRVLVLYTLARTE